VKNSVIASAGSKPTHTNLYLNAKSLRHPSNKETLRSTVVHRARALCNEDSLQAELVFLRALNRHPPLDQPDNKPNSVAFLPFVGIIFNHISRVLAQHNIKSVSMHHMKLSCLLYPVKDHLGPKTPGVYRIPCECSRVRIGQMGCMDIRLKEYQRHIWTSWP
jgi:hypothetical protein